MQGLLITCLFLAAWKGLDIALSAYQMHLQAKIELSRHEEPEEPVKEEEDSEIGFTPASSTIHEVYEEED